jgi:hypothetical protein
MDAERVVLLTIGIVTRDFGAENVTEEHIYPLLPTAVKQLQNKLVTSNPAKLENFRATFDVTAADGVADLSAIAEAGFRLDMIKRANIKVTYGENPVVKKVQLVNSLDRFTSASVQDRFYVLGYLEGSDLLLRDGADAAEDPTITFAGDLVIRGIYCPQTIDDLASELEGELVAVLVDLAKMAEKERRINRDIAERKA